MADRVCSPTIRQGAQGNYDTASKVSIASEFNTEDEDEAIKKILKEGTVQTMEVSECFSSAPGNVCYHQDMELTR